MVRGEAVLLVEPELADVWVTVRVRARDRQTALERCQATQARGVRRRAAAGDARRGGGDQPASVHLEVRDRRAPGEPVATLQTRLTVGRLDAVGELVVDLGRLDDVDVSGAVVAAAARQPGGRAGPAGRRPRRRHRARQYAAAFGAHLTALLEVSDAGLGGGGLRVAGAMAPMARFEERARSTSTSRRPARRCTASVEVRFAMSAPDSSFFGT